MATPESNMGLGTIGGDSIIFKRKFRWTLKFEDICRSSGKSTTINENFVKLAARPSLTIEETEINFLHGKTWIPGKAAWETITVTYYDCANKELAGLWTWLWSVYDFKAPEKQGGDGGAGSPSYHMGSSVADYAGTGILTLYDGCGKTLEIWTMGHAWPQAINFQDLDYSNSEECTVELTLRYSEVTYQSLCPTFDSEGCCTGCGSAQNE